MIDASGEEHHSYDGRGRVEWTVKRIHDPVQLVSQGQLPAPLVSYATQFEYDSLDRVTRMTYPDNDLVEYHYNDRGLLQRITGGPSGSIFSGVAYLPSAQQNQLELGNGVRTIYEYDVRQRLTRLTTLAPLVEGAPGGADREELIHFAYRFDPASNLKVIEDLRPDANGVGAGKLRNTQIFTYDDLYRLTRVTYAGAIQDPAPATNYIAYRYDRLGNMLSQTSDITHDEKGLAVADLGTMAYGELGGSSNRMGRSGTDGAGPHSLSEIRNPKSGVQTYPYDANGNMTRIDGLRCTWDFKDRLVSVEDDTMRAEYQYDYADHRVSKRIIPKPGPSSSTNSSLPSPEFVAYVDKYFEVRAHDQPTKYVFNGDTRIARITGSLTSTGRVQRVRLSSGWNLCSVAVDGAAIPHPPEIAAIYEWKPSIQAWELPAADSTLRAGTVLWIKATTNTTLALTGGYVDPVTPQTVAAGGGFLTGIGLEARNLRTVFQPAGDPESHSGWYFDSLHQTWLINLPLADQRDPGFPDILAPGAVVYLSSLNAVELAPPNSALRIQYYHQDHLGSSSVITDGAGKRVEETAYYPFGVPRHRQSVQPIEADYGFTQKERDRESGLAYFGSRFMASRLSRFIRADSLAAELPAEWLGDPQKLNTYSYVGNNPMRFVDPKGMDREKPASSKPNNVLILYGESQFEDFVKQTGNRSRSDFERTMKASYSDEAGAGAQVDVKRLALSSKDDLEKMFKGTSYDVIIYNGHGSSKTKELLPGGKVSIKPEDLKDALAGASTVPKRMFFYGCNTAKSGFARVTSELLPKTAITGTGARIAPYYQWDQGPKGARLNVRVLEDRTHNITFQGGAETEDVRKVNVNDVVNAPIR